MKYSECREWLENRRLKKGSKPGLTEVKKLLEAMNHQSFEIPYIHIAGTNGKGSIGYLIEASLTKSRFKVGRFLSPAVIDEREIILVNSKMVAKTVWERNLSLIIEKIESMNLEATAFEIEFVLSLMIFKDLKCDICIIECGMGGLLDATNVIDGSLVDIITSISMDHCAFLGDSLKEISLHKFGIIKQNSKNLVVAPQKDEIYDYLSEYLNEHSDCCNEIIKCDKSKEHHTHFCVNNSVVQILSYKEYTDLKYSLAGEHQIDNAITALDVLDILKKEGL